MSEEAESLSRKSLDAGEFTIHFVIDKKIKIPKSEIKLVEHGITREEAAKREEKKKEAAKKRKEAADKKKAAAAQAPAKKKPIVKKNIKKDTKKDDKKEEKEEKGSKSPVKIINNAIEEERKIYKDLKIERVELMLADKDTTKLDDAIKRQRDHIKLLESI